MTGWIFGELNWTLSRNWAKRTVLLVVTAAVLTLIVHVPLSSLYDRLFWSDLERAYYDTYYRSSVSNADEQLNCMFLVIDVGTPQGGRMAFLASNDDVTREGDHFGLTSEGRRRGAVNVRWVTYPSVRADAVYWHLRDHIYNGETPSDLSAVPRWASWLFFGSIVAFGIVWERRDRLRRKKGEQERGPELLSPQDFNRLRRGDGVAIKVEHHKHRRFPLNTREECIQLRQQDESMHFLVMGDTGSGKSVLIMQILDQLQARGDAVIVYDPAREFIPRYFDNKRGDVLLNPLDQRSPYWDPSTELSHPDEALTIAKSLFPDKERENHFFTESSRKIFAFLLTFRPSAMELIHWMSNPDEIDKRLANTALAPLIDKNAPPQRSAVLSTLNLVSDALKLLPSREEAKEPWSAVSWTRKRQGWIFLSSTPETREPLLPLLSMWLDLLVLRLMASDLQWARKNPVWIVADEVATLQRLPQMATALTESRKSNVRIILGFQGRSQIEARYGVEAEVMLSQPATKIFLRTSEPRAAKWISDSIGEVTTERMRESVTAAVRNNGDSANYSLNRTTEPLISPAQITGLASLEGYLKSENHVVRFRFEPNPLPGRVAPFIPRIRKELKAEKLADYPANVVERDKPPNQGRLIEMPTSVQSQQRAETPEFRIWE